MNRDCQTWANQIYEVLLDEARYNSTVPCGRESKFDIGIGILYSLVPYMMDLRQGLFRRYGR